MPIDILRAFTDAPKPLDFVLPGLLAGTVGCFVSPKSFNKSMFAIELALLVSTGFDCSGFGGGVKHPLGKVAFFSAQDHGDVICQKLHALGKHVDMSLWNLFSEQCEIESFSSMSEKHRRGEWFDFVQPLSAGKRLLLLDTTSLSRWFGKDDNAKAANFLAQLENIACTSGCAIVVLENVERPEDVEHWEDAQKDFTGSSPLIENISWKIYLDDISVNESGEILRAEVFKQNCGFFSNDIYVQPTENGVLIPVKF